MGGTGEQVGGKAVFSSENSIRRVHGTLPSLKGTTSFVASVFCPENNIRRVHSIDQQSLVDDWV